ncbi:monovalent cation/H(+) antiporter subunit G [Croceibacterium ferulae]|uniref:monovalent cation/H(+) antiporter subunit G n=1 Tax=Croceibacterium ferulae TaxID=1854641 RepID=UPI000EAD5F27|nr:monovalent cation/H(+) antiporter subunit G [Croceibacterium ferulae]
MTQAPDLPLWAAILAAIFVLIGAGATFIGSMGLLRLKTFYERVHSPTMGTTLGTVCILLASACVSSVVHARFSVHEALIFLFVSLTTPVTLMLLARAALYRDRVAGDESVPVEDDRSN